MSAGSFIAKTLIFLALATTSSAGDISSREALHLREQGLILSLENLLDLIQKRHPQSSLLEVDLEKDDGIYIYEVEILTTKGVVRELEINAATGIILQDEEDD
jgi:uncharacterized membrane protein YkoI